MEKDNHDKDNHNLVIEFNVDDINPQHVPYLLEKLLEEGASDAFVTPIIMKKGRPGYLFTITCCQFREEKILEIIFSESTTIGVRKIKTEGVKLDRKIYNSHSSFGEIQVKEIIMPSGKKKIIPEYDDCKKIADKEKLPLKEVQEKLLNEFNPNENFLPISNN
jgi:pyridinium-3,5-bisthiocarboxylic acid mononucleotide nickel chelatase